MGQSVAQERADMSQKDDPPLEPLDLTPWIIEGVSEAAIARAEFEASRRGLLLAEWIEEVIERALIDEKSGGSAPRT
jgi:hypothetical protein